jgi:hypothetical protein
MIIEPLMISSAGKRPKSYGDFLACLPKNVDPRGSMFSCLAYIAMFIVFSFALECKSAVDCAQAKTLAW